MCPTLSSILTPLSILHGCVPFYPMAIEDLTSKGNITSQAMHKLFKLQRILGRMVQSYADVKWCIPNGWTLPSDKDHYTTENNTFTESAHWADSVIEPRCPSVCTSVCLCVCPL